MSEQDKFVSPQVKEAKKLLPMCDLILLNPERYKSLTKEAKEGFYGFKQIDEDYQDLFITKVDPVFYYVYQGDEPWRTRFVMSLFQTLPFDDPVLADKFLRIISVFEAVISENYLQKR